MVNIFFANSKNEEQELKSNGILRRGQSQALSGSLILSVLSYNRFFSMLLLLLLHLKVLHTFIFPLFFSFFFSFSILKNHVTCWAAYRNDYNSISCLRIRASDVYRNRCCAWHRRRIVNRSATYILY